MVVINNIIRFGLRIETEAERTTIIVDIFDIIQQQVRGTGIHLEIYGSALTRNICLSK